MSHKAAQIVPSPASTHEIERKFLVKNPPDLAELRNQEIIQGYINIDDDYEVRIRQKGDTYFQTTKSGNGLVRKELEIELKKEQFEALWNRTEGRHLIKTRYEISSGESVIELDVYQGSLAGLIVAEVEFSSVETSKAFSAPTWFDREITEDERYKNKNLAIYGIPKGMRD